MSTIRQLPKLTFALVLAIGIVAIWMIFAGWCSSVVMIQRGRAHESLAYTPQGEPIIQMTSQDGGTSYRGLDGQRRNFNSEAVWLTSASLAGVAESSWLRPPPSWPARIAALSDGGSPPNFWYFMHDGRPAGGGYFVGYSSVSQRIVGYFGRSGWRDSPPVSTADCFAVPVENFYYLQHVLVSSGGHFYRTTNEPWYFSSQSRVLPGWRVYLIDANRVVEVDLRKHNAAPRTVMEGDELISLAILYGANYSHSHLAPVTTAPVNSAAADRTENQGDVLIASTADQILIYDPVADMTSSIELPKELRSKALSVSRTRSGDFILQYTSYDPETGMPVVSYTISPLGDVKDRIEVQLNRGHISSPLTQSLVASAVAPFPLASTLFVSLSQPLTKMQIDKSLSYGQALIKSASEGWLFLTLTFVVAGVLAWRCRERQRQFAEPSMVPWVALVLLLGVPGYVAYRIHRRWPIRLLCPACHMPGPRNRADCIDCGAMLPPSEVKGIEVFA